jgi:hypothetical protein
MLFLMTTSQRFLYGEDEVPPHWAELVENSSREKVTEKNMSSGKHGSFRMLTQEIFLCLNAIRMSPATPLGFP